MALIDTWELMPPSMSAEKDEIRKMFHDLIDAMLPYQDEKTGMWHQVINLPNIAPTTWRSRAAPSLPTPS